MQEIRLYIYTDAPMTTEDRGSAAYLLQYVKEGREIGSRADSITFISRNQKGATLEAIIAALTRINDANTAHLTIICHTPGVIQAINQSLYTKWALNGWTNSRGKEVEYATEWQRIVQLIKDKAPEITARAPAADESEIMYQLGAGYFLPEAKMA